MPLNEALRRAQGSGANGNPSKGSGVDTFFVPAGQGECSASRFKSASQRSVILRMIERG